MHELVFDDMREALRHLPDADRCDLAREVEATHPSWEAVLAAMDDALDGDKRKRAWEWVLKRLEDANDDPDHDNDEDFERITRLRHLRYALAHYLFFYADLDQIGGSAAAVPA